MNNLMWFVGGVIFASLGWAYLIHHNKIDAKKAADELADIANKANKK